MDARLVISQDDITPRLKRLGKRITNIGPFFKIARNIILKKTRDTFDKLSDGGSYRGVTWERLAPQYTRMDGTVIPAHGGVKKVRGQGSVKGRKRASGKRVTSSTNIMRDAGKLSRGGSLGTLITRDKLILRSGLSYGKFQQRMRAWLFFQDPQDPREFRKRFIEYVSA